MFRRKIMVVFLAFTGLFNSCDVMDQKYYMGYDADEVFTKAENIRATAIGMYRAVKSAYTFGGRTQIYVDIRSDATNIASYFGNISEVIGVTAANATLETFWFYMYRAVSEVNYFMKGIAENPGVVSAAEEEQFVAEAKFLRAVVNFYTLNFYGDQYTADSKGLGIPIVEETYDGSNGFDEDAVVPRSTVDQCYDAILKDLNDALVLPENNSSDPVDNLTRATRGAVYAFMSRVYLYRGMYAEAIEAANNVTGYQLDTDINTLFNYPPTSSKEIIFWFANSENDNPNTNNSLGQHYRSNLSGGRADVSISDYLINKYEPTDIRFTDLTEKDEGVYWTTKYKNTWAWAPLIRYAEVLLNKAEALAKQDNGINAEAIAIVNQIRTRSNASTVDAINFASKDDLVEFILDERFRELAFEGHRSFDLFRNQKGIPTRGTIPAISYPNNWFAFPIPAQDVERSKGVLVQNPGYAGV